MRAYTKNACLHKKLKKGKEERKIQNLPKGNKKEGSGYLVVCMYVCGNVKTYVFVSREVHSRFIQPDNIPIKW